MPSPSTKYKGKAKAETPKAETPKAETPKPQTPKPQTPKRKLPLAPSPVQPRADEDNKIVNPKIRARLTAAGQESIDQACEPAHSAKRNFSELSIKSAGGPESKIAKMDSQSDPAVPLLHAMLEFKEKNLEACEAVIRILKQHWESGDLDTKQSLFDHEISRLERVICQFQADIVILRTSFNTICGEMRDNAFFTSTTQADNQAYVDLLLQRYRTPLGARLTLFQKREPSAQDRFRRDVFKAYGAETPSAMDSVWCVITGDLIPSSLVTAAHIVRYNVGEVTAGHLFGPSIDKNGHLMSAKNGLPIANTYEEAFDQGRLVIVPNEEKDLVVAVLDEDIKKIPRSSNKYPWNLDATLHGRRLKFPNDFRPSMRYLYFSCCINILSRQRHEVDSWSKDRLDPLMPTKNWASPGDYLRSSTLQKVAQLVGHITSEEATSFATSSPFESTDDAATDELDSAHAHIIKASALGVKSNEKEDEEDEEDEEDDEEEEEEEDDELERRLTKLSVIMQERKNRKREE